MNKTQLSKQWELAGRCNECELNQVCRRKCYAARLRHEINRVVIEQEINNQLAEGVKRHVV